VLDKKLDALPCSTLPSQSFVVHGAELMLIWRDGGESRVRIRENSG
jgi:hypothetical protein